MVHELSTGINRTIRICGDPMYRIGTLKGLKKEYIVPPDRCCFVSAAGPRAVHLPGPQGAADAHEPGGRHRGGQGLGQDLCIEKFFYKYTQNFL